MQPDWITVERMAEAFGLTVPAALELAERMNWPRVFKARETLVLAPQPAARA
ncbi:hypothetical protein [Methylobacterium trifolii]|uniref:DNA-binding protein n=1 Tax=Methylobacterium trifolii TaxID=1003092 RepID=A0ABQ4TX59_9HYPH|nr:hypothetical protein [Methylobacterium trifolii]GJE58190.1 hypothetical protein MPOCJGCO_0269 [Methylobacterium trifolii]